MAIHEARLIIVEGGQLLDATTMASLALLLSSARVTKMLKMLGPEVRVVATKAMAIKAMVIVMVAIMGRPVVGPKLWMPMSIRDIGLVFLKGIN